VPERRYETYQIHVTNTAGIHKAMSTVHDTQPAISSVATIARCMRCCVIETHQRNGPSPVLLMAVVHAVA